MITLLIGPDETAPGITYTITDDDGSLDSDGWGGSGPRTPTTDAWFALARRRIRLPKPVKAAGLIWNSASVEPFGWSQGPGHAPQGIRVVWAC